MDSMEQFRKAMMQKEANEKIENEKQKLKTISGILLAIILFLIIAWYQSEQRRIKLLDELNTVKAEYEELYERTMK